jgi:hypothetical protein
MASSAHGPMLRAALIFQAAKKMQLDALKAMVKQATEELKQSNVAVQRERQLERVSKRGVKVSNKLNPSAVSGAKARVYKKNATNDRLGRSGNPIPQRAKKVSTGSAGGGSAGGSAKARVYAKNAHNDRLGRSGKPIPPRKKAKKKAPLVVDSMSDDDDDEFM